MHWISASLTHVGLLREINEDACLDAPEKGLWAVADGMGGHSLGDMASRAVIEALARLAPAASLEEATGAIRTALNGVNLQLRQEAAARAADAIGTTVVVLAAVERRCAWLWAGDSRIYLYRQGQLRQLSRDHSQVEEMQALGLLSPEEAADHPLRHLITRAVGAEAQLEVDADSLEVLDGDMFLLCSDGLSNEVSAAEIAAALAPGDCRQAAQALVEAALRHGGRDNIAVVVVRAEDGANPERTIINPDFV